MDRERRCDTPTSSTPGSSSTTYAAAKERFGELLGVTWFEGGGDVRMITDDGTVRAAYALSKKGPHVELAQSVDGTLWTATGPGRCPSATGSTT